jgi:hypothetical protein
MKPHEHVLITLIVSAAIFPTYGLFTGHNILLLLIGTTVFDIDHLLYFIVAKRSLDMRRFLRSVEKTYRNLDTKIQIFHTFDFAILFTIVAFLYRPLLFVYAGYIIHCMADWARAYFILRRDPVSLARWTRYWILGWNIRNNYPFPEEDD